MNLMQNSLRVESNDTKANICVSQISLHKPNPTDT